MLDLVIQNGSVVFPGERVRDVSVGVTGGRISGFFDAASAPEARETIDARGLHLFPGAIDPHTHLGFYQPFQEDIGVDTRCAALGGYTSLVNYYRHAASYRGTIAEMIEAACRVSTIDFALSLGLLRRAHWDEFEEVVRETGVTSWKFYRQYEGEIGRRFKVDDALPLDDNDLLETLRRFGELSDKLLVCVHCEDMDIARAAARELREHGPDQSSLAAFAQSSPGYAETVSVLSALYLARIAGTHNMYIVHLSSGLSVDLLERLRWLQAETGTVVETTPHYLNLTKHAPANLLAVVGPPIQEEWDRDRLWQAIGEGIITSYGGDHIPCRPLAKKTGPTIWETKFGFGSTGVMLPLMLSEGHHRRGLPLEQLAYLMSTGPAKSFGLYPRKGAMEVGADADFAFVDLGLERTVSGDMPEVADGYSVYEGMTLKGWPVKTMLRGKLIAENRKLQVEPGYGQYLRREM